MLGNSPRDLHTQRILAELEAGKSVSQRSLSRDLGIALGLTNLLMREVVRKGWVRAISVKPNRVAYLITPAGIAEKARMSRDYFARTIGFYSEARDRIRDSFRALSAALDPPAAEPADKRIVFYGSSEVAEIGYVCLAETDLRLVGVVDDGRQRPFFGLSASPVSSLREDRLDHQPFERLVVMSFIRLDEIASELDAVGFPPDRTVWL